MNECNHCGQFFDPKRAWQKYCSKPCGSKGRNEAYYRNNYEKISEDRRKYNSDWPKMVTMRIKSRAKKSNIPFNITEEDIDLPTHCPVLGVELRCGVGSGYHAQSPSVDRIIPALGYVKGNVRVISARANLLKNDATVEELQKVLNDLTKIKEKHGFSV